MHLCFNNDTYVVSNVAELNNVKLKRGDKVVIIADTVTSLVVADGHGDIYLLEGSRFSSDAYDSTDHDSVNQYVNSDTTEVSFHILYLRGDQHTHCLEVEATIHGHIYGRQHTQLYTSLAEQLTDTVTTTTSHVGDGIHHYTVGLQTANSLQGFNTSLQLVLDTRTWTVDERFFYVSEEHVYLIIPTIALTSLWWSTIHPSYKSQQPQQNYKDYQRYLNYLELLADPSNIPSAWELEYHLELAPRLTTPFLTPLYTEGDVQVYGHNASPPRGEVVILRSGKRLLSDESYRYQTQASALLRYLAHYENINPQTGAFHVNDEPVTPLYHDAGGIIYYANLGVVIKDNWYYRANYTELEALRQRYTLYLTLTQEA